MEAVPAGSPAVQGRAGRGNLSGYQMVHASREFRTLQRRLSSFVVPATALFAGWYFLYVLIAAFAPGFMRISVFGDVNVGLCFGALQFVSTFAITVAYYRWAGRNLDPMSRRIRDRLEAGRRQ